MVKQLPYHLIILTLLWPLVISAQKVKTVHGTYVYHAPDNVSLDQAKQTAIERAKLQAIADEFGTIISQSNSTIIKQNEDQSSIDFLSIGSSDVKGEWIETIGEPIVNISWEQNTLVVTADVKGKAREIRNTGIDLVAKTLRNSPSLRYADTEFNNGDDLFLYFKSPVNGFLSVYLHDVKNGMVYCLLPYKSSIKDCVEIEHDREYVFFSAMRDEDEFVDEYVLTASEKKESNVLFIIFSPNKTYKANTLEQAELAPRMLGYQDFSKWISNILSKDENTICEKIYITINQ